MGNIGWQPPITSKCFLIPHDSTSNTMGYHGYICKMIASVLSVPSTADFVKPSGCSCWGIPFSKPWLSPFEGYTPHQPEVFAIITGHIICSSDQPHINNLSVFFIIFHMFVWLSTYSKNYIISRCACICPCLYSNLIMVMCSVFPCCIRAKVELLL